VVGGRSGFGRLAVWHLPGGPFGPPFRWAATSNVEVGKTPYRVNRGKVEREEDGRTERGTKSQRGGEGRREWNRGGDQGPLAQEGG